MDEIPPDELNSEPPAREKRTLRTAIDGSPSRPDAKVGRGADDLDNPAAALASTGPHANSPVFARCTRIRRPHDFAQLEKTVG